MLEHLYDLSIFSRRAVSHHEVGTEPGLTNLTLERGSHSFNEISRIVGDSRFETFGDIDTGDRW